MSDEKDDNVKINKFERFEEYFEEERELLADELSDMDELYRDIRGQIQNAVDSKKRIHASDRGKSSFSNLFISDMFKAAIALKGSKAGVLKQLTDLKRLVIESTLKAEKVEGEDTDNFDKVANQLLKSFAEEKKNKKKELKEAKPKNKIDHSDLRKKATKALEEEDIDESEIGKRGGSQEEILMLVEGIKAQGRKNREMDEDDSDIESENPLDEESNENLNFVADKEGKIYLVEDDELTEVEVDEDFEFEYTKKGKLKSVYWVSADKYLDICEVG
jgi:hypothetical protein